MKKFLYIIAEGVLDVVFLTEILLLRFSLPRVSHKPDLTTEAAKWLENFKWPIGNDIKRLAVPAPVLLQNEQWIVGLRNAGGDTKISTTIRSDHEAFLRAAWNPVAVGIILDADDQPALERFTYFANVLESNGYPKPESLGSVATKDSIRSGVFAFPGDGKNGTIEDGLLAIAEIRFPVLSPYASEFVANWTDQSGSDFAELMKPSGRNKARISAITALLKPGKSPNASIEDHKWISNDPSSYAALRPVLAFLDALFA